MAGIHHTWAANVLVSVDAATEDLAHARFYLMVCERLRYPQARKSPGVTIRWPIPLEANFLYRNYQFEKRLRNKSDHLNSEKWVPALIPSWKEIEEIEKESRVFPQNVRMLLRYSLDAATTWEDSTKWLSDLFTPLVIPGMRFVSAEEDTISNWGS